MNMTDRGSKIFRCQEIAGLEASIFERKTLQICRPLSQSNIFYEEINALQISSLEKGI